MNRDGYLSREPALQRLFEAAFHRPLAAGVLPWRYAQNPVGDVQVELLEDGGEILAHYGSSGVEFRRGEERLLGGLVGAAMTHPSLQGKGVFQKLGRRHEEAARAAGYDFLFAFPHPNRHTDAIFVWKLGWEAVNDLPTQYFDLQNAQPREVTIEFDDAFSRFNYDEAIDRDGLFAAARTTSYLQWRYRDNPTNHYRNVVMSDADGLRAYAIVKFYAPGGVSYADVVDHYAENEETIPQLFEHVLEFCRAEGCRGVNVWTVRHHPVRHVLARLGFTVQLPVTYVSFRPLTPAGETLRQFANWWLTMGDSDVY
ncbi:MAG TPA: GNAT family N-acetyltransferase [Thermoanaerobaculia bacterium]|nr:GNAT family N-acetyltransferase [Thermoanaerobaculia bacterium]